MEMQRHASASRTQQTLTILRRAGLFDDRRSPVMPQKVPWPEALGPSTLSVFQVFFAIRFLSERPHKPQIRYYVGLFKKVFLRIVSRKLKSSESRRRGDPGKLAPQPTTADHSRLSGQYCLCPAQPPQPPACPVLSGPPLCCVGTLHVYVAKYVAKTGPMICLGSPCVLCKFC